MKTEESKYHYGREIIFNLRSCQAISADVYLHWLDKINKEEDIAVAHSSTLLNNSFEIGEKVLIKSCREVEISNFCEDGERVEIVDGCDYMLIDIEDLTKIV